MATQTALSFDPVNIVHESPFQKFHRENPHVYRYLLRAALDLRLRGIQHWTIRNLWECMRMDHALKTNGEPFKLNNNLTAQYARLLMQEPGLEGMFEVRS